MKDKFLEHYNKLNKEQKEAVDTIEGPVMVVAGPGTGKTQILTLRIANILRKTDTAPEQILALTFTDSSASGMKKRLAEIIGPSAYRVTVNTFHGFANNVIKRFPEEFPRIIGSKNITDIDQIENIEKIILREKLEFLKPSGNPIFYVRPVLQGINSLKREGVSVASFEKIIKNEEVVFLSIPDLYNTEKVLKIKYEKVKKQINKNKELCLIYKLYEEVLADKKLYDYSDMIMEVLRALSTNKTLLLMLQEEHQYILADEHQDTNNAQNKIIEALASFHQNPNVFVVGDEKQAIFRFQGASLANFLYFKNLYKHAKVITLKENYRSTQNILNASHSVISRDPLRANVSHENKKIKLLPFSDSTREAMFIAQDIARKLKTGIKPEEIAILYRDNRDAFPFARMLEKNNVPFCVESDEDIFSENSVKKMITLLRAIEHYGDDNYLAPALLLDFISLPPLFSFKLVRERGQDRNKDKNFLDIAERGVRGANKLENKIFKEFIRKVEKWKVMAENSDLLDFTESVLHDSGLLEDLLKSEDGFAPLESIKDFFSEINKFMESHNDAKLKDLLNYLEIIKKHEILVKKSSVKKTEGYVRLMTVHKSKGLEFDQVYITGVRDGHFGNKRNPNPLKLLDSIFVPDNKIENVLENDENDDERRLFFVALTRGRQDVFITYSKTDDLGKETLPSQFVTEIRPELIEIVDMKLFEDKIKSEQFLERKKTKTPMKIKDWVKFTFGEQDFSVTALNNYLLCPWKYFYVNLLRVPEGRNNASLFGDAMHKAIAEYFRISKDKKRGKNILLKIFENNIIRLPFGSDSREEYLERGEKALTGLFDKYKNKWSMNVKIEQEIKGVVLGDNIKLKGILDKIEFLNDTNNVNVVDYKTGKSKTRNQILGDTKSTSRRTDGNYFRQLVFYKILLDNYAFPSKIKYKMVTGEINFIEPDEKGNYKREIFEITEEHTKELEETIKKVAKEILGLKFWSSKCDKKDCDYCDMHRRMK